MKDCG